MKLHPFLIPALLLLVTTIVVVSCSKSNSSKPSISIKSINTTVNPGEDLDIHLNFSSKSQNIAKGRLVSIRRRLNQIPLPPGTGSADTLTGPVPDFPDQSKGEFEYRLPYLYVHQSDAENDTIVFKFAVIDRAGTSSDTITTPIIVVIKP